VFNTQKLIEHKKNDAHVKNHDESRQMLKFMDYDTSFSSNNSKPNLNINSTK